MLVHPLFALALLGTLLAIEAACPCGDESLCKPVSIPVASSEIFAFATGDSWKHFLQYEPKVTTIAVFGSISPLLVCTAHEHEARVVVGTAFGGDLTDASARSAYVNKTVTMMEASGIDGLNIDIEHNSDHRDELTTLVTELASAARAVNPLAQISFDLAIKPNGQTQGYDHKSLSKVLDFIVPMAYDECWGTSSAAANSPLKALADGVKQYQNLGIPAEKLVIGLPWYAWDFPCDSSESYSECHITVPKGKVWYGYVTQISYSAANITAEHGSQQDSESVTMITEYFENVNGTEKRHQQWFDNAATLSLKYSEVGRLGCRGVAFWTADEVDYSSDQGKDMWGALASFTLLGSHTSIVV